MTETNLKSKTEATKSVETAPGLNDHKRILLVEGDGFTRLVLLLRLRLAVPGESGYGARVGLLSESIIVPGVSLTVMKRDLPTVDIAARSTATDSLFVTGLVMLRRQTVRRRRVTQSRPLLPTANYLDLEAQ